MFSVMLCKKFTTTTQLWLLKCYSQPNTESITKYANLSRLWQAFLWPVINMNQKKGYGGLVPINNQPQHTQDDKCMPIIQHSLKVGDIL